MLEKALQMIKENYSKTITILLMSWYAIFRWILLSQGSSSSTDWLRDWQGNTIAILSLVYMGYFLLRENPQKSKLFFAATSILLFVNLYFLILMIGLFIKEPTAANFGYTILDISIASYYFFIMKTCLFGNDKGIGTFKVNIQCLG